MQKTVRIINLILLILAVVCVFGIFSGPISSADFWWHLKSGQYIYETRSLPATDPFSFTTGWDAPDKQTLRNQHFTLKQSWLAQIFMYGIYRLFSFEGIIYMRAALLTLLIMLLYRNIRREGMGLYVSLFLVLPTVIIYAGFTPERPQLFSFVFFGLMVFLLEGFRSRVFFKFSQPISDVIARNLERFRDDEAISAPLQNTTPRSPRPDFVEPRDDRTDVIASEAKQSHAGNKIATHPSDARQ